MLSRRFPVFLSVLALLSAAATGGFAQTTISSGQTVQSSTLTNASWPVTVQSGGTLNLNQKDVGNSSQILTISGTGNGTVSTTDATPHGALYSNIFPGMAEGIKAKVEISGTASTTVTNGNRLRFQGNVTGGTLTTYSLGAGETHAGLYSSFNIENLIIAKGNFTFNATDNSSTLALTHIFTNGIEVQNGGVLRLWACSQGLSLYSNAEKTTLATVTLNAGGVLKVENSAAKIKANLNAAGNSSLTVTTNLEWQAGSITGTGTLTMSGSKLTMDSGTSISAPLTINSGTLEMNSGSSITGTLGVNAGTVNLYSGSSQSGAINLTGGTVNFAGTTTGTTLKVTKGTANFNSGASFTGKIDYGTFGETKPSININSGATVTLTDDAILGTTLKTLSGSLIVAAGKTVEAANADTSANTTKGTITLNEGSTLKVRSNTTSKFNADVTLAGNATITLDAVSQAEQGLSNLTVKSINASGKTLSFGSSTAPGGTLTADSITANKLMMGNSSNLTVNDLSAGTISFFRVNNFSIANSLTLGDGGVSKSNTSTSTCSFIFGENATVKMLTGATNSTILSQYGDYDVKFNGTLNFDLTGTQTLTWKNSKFIGTATETPNKIVKAGDGTLNLNLSGSTNLAEVQLNAGTLGVGGTLNTTLTVTKGTLNFNSGAKFSGKIAYGTFGETKPSININSGATVTLNDATTLDSTLKTLSGSLAMVGGKTLTVNGVDTSANATKGTITLNAGANLLVKSSTTSKFNADLKLAGDATITLEALTASDVKKAALTVKSIDATGKTLTFGASNNPGGTLTADSVTANKIQMNNSSDFIVKDLTAGSIVFYRINDFKIANSLTLGAGGATKGYNQTSNCVFTFSDGATVKLLDSATSSKISSSYGDYDVKLNGTLNINLAENQTLTWQNSNFKGTSGKTNKLVKTGDGTLNLIPKGSSNLAGVQLNDGATNLSGTLTATTVTLAEDAVLSTGNASETFGTGKIVGSLDANGKINLEFNNSGNDALEITGTADFTDSELLLTWLGEEVPQSGKTYTFLKAGTLTGLTPDLISISESVASYFNPVILSGNTLTLSVKEDSSVPEPATWFLLVLGLVGIGKLTFKNKK